MRTASSSCPTAASPVRWMPPRPSACSTRSRRSEPEMFRLVLSSLRANVRRRISTSVAVCLGVALLAGTMVLGDTLKANFDSLFNSALGKADAVVRSSNTLDTDGEFAQDLIPESFADDITTLDG